MLGLMRRYCSSAACGRSARRRSSALARSHRQRAYAAVSVGRARDVVRREQLPAGRRFGCQRRPRWQKSDSPVKLPTRPPASVTSSDHAATSRRSPVSKEPSYHSGDVARSSAAPGRRRPAQLTVSRMRRWARSCPCEMESQADQRSAIRVRFQTRSRLSLRTRRGPTRRRGRCAPGHDDGLLDLAAKARPIERVGRRAMAKLSCHRAGDNPDVLASRAALPTPRRGCRADGPGKVSMIAASAAWSTW